MGSHDVFKACPPKQELGNWTYFNWENWEIGLNTFIETYYALFHTGSIVASNDGIQGDVGWGALRQLEPNKSL